MPRDITITLQDGSTRIYRGAPDNITPAQVTARAQKDFGMAVTALDGGRRRNISASRTTPVARTREQEIQDIARRNIETLRNKRKQLGWSIDPREEAMTAGAFNFLGIGPAVEAGYNYLGDVLSGRPTDFSRNLDIARAENRMQQEESPTASFIGSMIGGGAGGGLALKGVGKAAGALASSGSRAAQIAGRALQSATTLQKGQRARNIARIAGGGAVGGGSQAAGEGSNVLRGAGYGTVGALAFGAAARPLKWLAGKARDILHSSSIDNVLRKYTTINADELASKAQRFRERTSGQEPTVYELLPLEDRQKLQDVIGKFPGSERQRVSELATERVQAIPSEVLRTARRTTQGATRARSRELANELAASRNAEVPEPHEAALAREAMNNPTRLAQLREQEAQNIMAPYDRTIAYDSLNELLPTAPVRDETGAVIQRITDPEVANAIRAAAGPITARPRDRGISVEEIGGMIIKLKKDFGKGIIERGRAEQAIAHLEGLLARDHPEVLPALARMNDRWAARSRQLEGMGELRLQSEVPSESPRELRKSLNIYETPEGTAGRYAGQQIQLTKNLEQAIQPALGTVRNVAESPYSQRVLGQNLGPEAATRITQSAQAQAEGARRLASLIAEKPSAVAKIEPGDIALLASSLNPGSMAYTKFRGIKSALRYVQGIPENRAQVMVDMLLSRDPIMTQQAVDALRTMRGGPQALRSIVMDLAAGAASVPSEGMQQPEIPQAPGDMQQPEIPQAPGGMQQPEIPQAPGGMQQPEIPQAPEDATPYTPYLQQIYQNTDPALLNLIDRVQAQESSGNPTATSSAGAYGLMQVMPKTAPDAAKLAGLPWDEASYRNDPAYNKILGIAYLAEMIRRYNGNVEHALAAYNAGPGTVDKWLQGKQKNLPQETQDYIRKIL